MAQQRLQLNLTANTSGFTGALNTASSKLQKFGWKPNYSLECALSKTYKKKFIDINN